MGHEEAPRPKGFAFPTTATLPAIFRKVVGSHPFLLWSSVHHTLQPWWSKHATPLLGAWLFPPIDTAGRVTARGPTTSPQQKGPPHVQFPDQHASAGFSRRPLRRAGGG